VGGLNVGTASVGDFMGLAQMINFDPVDEGYSVSVEDAYGGQG
jgi:hypothetical protein